jgi:hypothetical protein
MHVSVIVNISVIGLGPKITRVQNHEGLAAMSHLTAGHTTLFVRLTSVERNGSVFPPVLVRYMVKSEQFKPDNKYVETLYFSRVVGEPDMANSHVPVALVPLPGYATLSNTALALHDKVTSALAGVHPPSAFIVVGVPGLPNTAVPHHHEQAHPFLLCLVATRGTAVKDHEQILSTITSIVPAAVDPYRNGGDTSHPNPYHKLYDFKQQSGKNLPESAQESHPDNSLPRPRRCG